MSLIHARFRDGTWVYRLWSSTADAYFTGDLSDVDVKRILLDDCTVRDIREGRADQAIEERLARTRINGTSSFRGDTQDIGGSWETERCTCGDFHHTFQPGSDLDGLCEQCGEQGEDSSHGPPCGTHD